MWSRRSRFGDQYLITLLTSHRSRFVKIGEEEREHQERLRYMTNEEMIRSINPNIWYRLHVALT